MLSYLLLPENITFACALGLLLVLGALQVVSFLLGTELFASLDDLVGGVGAPDVDVHAGLDAGVDANAADAATALAEADADLSPSFAQSLLGLLGIGKVPFIFSFLVFLFTYSALGYNGQLLLMDLGVGPLPVWLGSLLSFVVSLPVLRAANEVLARIVPRDESSAVSEQTFIGKIARVTVGTASYTRFTEARLEDDHGHTHLVHVFADEDGQTFRAGDEVILVGQRGNQFTVVGASAALHLEE